MAGQVVVGAGGLVGIAAAWEKLTNWALNVNGADNTAPVPDATPGRETKGRTKQWVKPGGMPEANRDFDGLRPGNISELPDGGRRGVLPDGRNINVRPDSTDGRPTVEIQDGKRRIKVRYY